MQESGADEAVEVGACLDIIKIAFRSAYASIKRFRNEIETKLTSFVCSQVMRTVAQGEEGQEKGVVEEEDEVRRTPPVLLG